MSNEDAMKKVQELMEGPMSFYNSERKEGEMNLVSLVRDRMIQIGLGERLPAAFDQNRFIVEALNKPAHAQQYLLNRYLTLQFMACPYDTTTQRYALIYEIKPDEWLNVFDNVILPALASFDLPVPL